MKVESFSLLCDGFEDFLKRNDIKIKHITSVHVERGFCKHYVFYKEKLLPKIIKTILHKK